MDSNTSRNPVEQLKIILITSPLSIPEFSPLGKFKVNLDNKQDPEVRIDYIDPNLLSLMTEEPAQEERTLFVSQMKEPSKIAPIVSQLSNQSLTFGQIWQILKMQGHGEKGLLLLDESQVNFYILPGIYDVLSCNWWEKHQCWHPYLNKVFSSATWENGNRLDLS